MFCTLPLLLMVTVLSGSPVKLHSAQGHNRTLRGQDCYEDEYRHKGRCCITCPAGTYVYAHCTENHARGICKPCTPGEDFTASPSGLEKCVPCLICKNDKVLVQKCTPKSDAICECRPGYYCSHDEPCEMCNRCSRCGKGQRIKEKCTSTNNTVCEDILIPISTSTTANVKDKQTVPESIDSSKNVAIHKEEPTKPPNDSAGSNLHIIVPVVIGLCLLAVIGIFFYKKKIKDKNKRSLIPGTLNNSENTSLYSVQSIGKDPQEEEVVPEQQRLMPPELKGIAIDTNQQAVPAVPAAQSDVREGKMEKCPHRGGDRDDVEDLETPELGRICNECKLPQPCDRHWDIFFYSILDHIRPDLNLELVRKLHLHKATENQIICDNQNNCREQNYKLLNEWRIQKGAKASMKAVLKELRDMDLGGCCENIINDLRIKGIAMN